MGKLVEFSINLDLSKNVYYPGDEIKGCVVIDLSESMNMRCLRIEFIGTGYCHWTEVAGTEKMKNTTRYEGNEKIVQKELCLFGVLSKSKSDVSSHPAGKYSYQFSFTLPKVMPSSFELQQGNNQNSPDGNNYSYIRYLLKAQIEKPWKFDYKVKHPIIVNEIIDANLPEYNHGTGNELGKRSSGCCCCFKKPSNPLVFSASINRGCYCPGEPILLSAHVKNKTNQHLKSLTAEICQKIRYRASGRTTTVEICIDDLQGPQILKGASFTWEKLPFLIPPIPPTITNSNTMSVKYEIKLHLDVPGGTNEVLTMPVVIGTVPFKTRYQKFIQHYKTIPPASFMEEIKYPEPIPDIFSYPDMPTKTTPLRNPEVVYGYCRSINDTEVDISDKDDKYTHGVLKYIPLYTFVKISREISGSLDSLKPRDPQNLLNVTI